MASPGYTAGRMIDNSTAITSLHKPIQRRTESDCPAAGGFVSPMAGSVVILNR